MVMVIHKYQEARAFLPLTNTYTILVSSSSYWYSHSLPEIARFSGIQKICGRHRHVIEPKSQP